MVRSSSSFLIIPVGDDRLVHCVCGGVGYDDRLIAGRWRANPADQVYANRFPILANIASLVIKVGVNDYSPVQ